MPARGRSAPSGVAVALLALLGIAGGAVIVAALPGAGRPVLTAAPSEAAVATPTPVPTPTRTHARPDADPGTHALG